VVKNVNLLIVDDDIRTLEIVEDVFQESGYEYNIAMVNDARKAIRLVGRRYFDVVLMDIRMPGINGLETYKEVKRIIPTAAVIMMTGENKEELLEKAMEKVRMTKEGRKKEKAAILIVDDDPNYRIASVLKAEGYKVSKVQTAMASIKEIQRKFFNVVLVKCELADISGFELAKKIKTIDKYTYIILVTGHASLETALKTIEMREEIYGYVVKGRGFGPEHLKRTIRKALREQRLVWDKMEAEDELRRANRRLEELSITDDLTGIYNRRHFYEKLSEMTARAKRYKLPLSLLMFDVDHFKSYKDTRGHLAGNRVLKRVGRIVSEEIREVDWGFRYGEDEFAVILPETSKKDATIVAEKIRKAFEKCKFDETTLSIGIAQYDLKSDLDTLIKHADEARYKAKSQGGNRIEVYGM